MPTNIVEKARISVFGIAILFIVLIVYIMSTNTKKQNLNHCASPGYKEVCPDVWGSNVMDAYKECGGNLTWDNSYTYGPGSCKVTCRQADMIPCEKVMDCIPASQTCGGCRVLSDCSENAIACDPTKGICICKPKWSGDKCDVPLPNNVTTCKTCDPSKDPSTCVPSDCGHADATNKDICAPGWGFDAASNKMCGTCIPGFGPLPEQIIQDPTYKTSMNAWGGNDMVRSKVQPCSMKMFTSPIHTKIDGVYMPNLQMAADPELRDAYCKHKIPGSEYTGSSANVSTSSLTGVSAPLLTCTLNQYYANPKFNPNEWNRSHAANVGVSPESVNNTVIGYYPSAKIDNEWE
jgi:hypothetical protein